MKVVILSDLHFTGSTQWAKITDDMLDRINNISNDSEKILFAFLGDLINGCIKREEAEANYILVGEYLDYIRNKIDNCYFCFVPGNHDLFSGIEGDAQLDLFNSFIRKYSIKEGCVFTSKHSVYSFEEEEVNFILVDSNLSRNYNYDGQINLEEIRQNIDRNKKNIIFMHHPPCKQEETSGEDDKSIRNPNELISTNSQFIFYGHQHGFHKVLDYFRNDTDIHGIGAFLKTDEGVKRDFILLDIHKGSINSAYRYKYNDIKFQKYILFPKRGNLRSEDVEITEPIQSDVEIYVDRNYRITNDDRRREYTIQDIIKNNDRIIITGAAGMGKSIEACHIYQLYKYNIDYFPYYVNVKSIIQYDINKIVEYGKEYTIDRKNILFIIDGINEVLGEQYQKLYNTILSLSNSVIKIIVMTRNDSDIYLRGFQKFVLEPFNEKQIKDYAIKSEIENADSFLSELIEKSYKIAENPFYLKMAVLIYKTDKYLPRISEFIKTALQKRFIDSSRKISAECSINIMDNEHKLNSSFKELAFVMQEIEKPYINNENYTEILSQEIRNLQQYSGIIILHEDTYQRYFEHDLFREYYVSELIYKLPIDQLSNIISCEIHGKKYIKTFWHEVVYHIINKRESNDLIDWLMKNDIEFFLKAEPEKLPYLSSINILVLLIDYCLRHKLNIRTVNFDFEKLIQKYQSEELWAFVLDKTKESRDDMSLLTLLNVWKCAPRDLLNKSFLDYLLTLIKDNEEEYITVLILQIFSKSGKIDEYIEKIVSKTKETNNTMINKELFTLISYSSLPDSYFDLVWHKFKEKKQNEIHISFDQSFKEYICSLKTVEKMLVSISYIGKNSPYLRIYHSDEMLNELIKKISEIYNQGSDNNNMILEEMYTAYTNSCKTFSYNTIRQILTFFIRTNTNNDILERLLKDKGGFNICFCLDNIIDSNNINDLIVWYKEGYIDDNIISWMILKGSIDEDCKNEIKTAYESKNGEPFVIEHIIEHSDTTERQEYLDICFDEEKLRNIVSELNKTLGPNTLIEDFLSHDNYIKFADNMIERKIAGAITRFELRNITIYEFTSSVNYRDFQLFVIFEQLILNKEIDLKESEILFLNKYFDEVVNSVNFEKVEPNEGEYYSISERVICLITKLGFKCTDQKLLEMLMLPWYVFTDTTYADDNPALDFVLEHISDKGMVEDRIKFNLNNKTINEEAIRTHINYCLQKNLSDAVSLAEKTIFLSSIQSLKICSLEYLINLKGEEYVDNLICPEMEDGLIKSLSLKLRHKNQNLLKEMIRRNKISDDKLDFVKELLDLNDINGLKLYFEFVSENKKIPEEFDPKYSSSDITMKIGDIKCLESMEYIKQLIFVAYSADFIDNDSRWGLKGNLSILMNYMVHTYPKEIIPILNEIIGKDKENLKLVSFCEYYIFIASDSIEKTEQRACTFEEAIKMLKTLV